jgi:hypothetical protein
MPSTPSIVEQQYTHLAVRTRMDIVGESGTWSAGQEDNPSRSEVLLDADNSAIKRESEASIERTPSLLSLEMDGHTTYLDLPIAYSVGRVQDGFQKPWRTYAASVKVSRSLESNQSVYVDYVFEIPPKAGQFVVATTSMDISNVEQAREDAEEEQETSRRPAGSFLSFLLRVAKLAEIELAYLIFASLLFSITICGWVLRRDKRGTTLPKGIVLSPDELGAHVDDLRDLGVIPPGRQEKVSCWSGSGELEIDIFNGQKSRVYVFDGETAEKKYVIVEVRGCNVGPLLLPPQSSDSDMLCQRWSPPEDRFIQLSDYLVQCMLLLKQEDWSGRIVQGIRGETLPRYQAAVEERYWRLLWDNLLKPFARQRAAYRGHYHCNKAPDMFFGVNARFVDAETSTTTDGLLDNGQSEVPMEGSSTRPEMNEGVPLPAAAEWLDFWSQHTFPQRWTFIEFASNLGEVTRLSRSRSFPDLTRPTASDSEQTLHSFGGFPDTTRPTTSEDEKHFSF